MPISTTLVNLSCFLGFLSICGFTESLHTEKSHTAIHLGDLVSNVSLFDEANIGMESTTHVGKSTKKPWITIIPEESDFHSEFSFIYWGVLIAIFVTFSLFFVVMLNIDCLTIFHSFCDRCRSICNRSRYEINETSNHGPIELTRYPSVRRRMLNQENYTSKFDVSADSYPGLIPISLWQFEIRKNIKLSICQLKNCLHFLFLNGHQFSQDFFKSINLGNTIVDNFWKESTQFVIVFHTLD